MSQRDLFPTESTWKRPEGFPELHGPMAIDTETRDPWLKIKGPSFIKPGTGYIVGISVCTAEFKGYYPIRHEGGDNFDTSIVLNWLQYQLYKPGPKIFANAQYDIGWLQQDKIEVNWAEVHDVQLMAPLVDENRFSFSLDNLGKDILGRGKDETLMKAVCKQHGIKAEEIKGDLWKLPGRFVGPYAEEDTQLTLDLWHHYMHEIETQELQGVYAMELKLIPILLKMRKRGIRVDLAKARQYKHEFMQKELTALGELNKITGMRIDPYSPDSVVCALDKFEIAYTKTKTGKPSITAEFLDTLDHPVGQLIRDARRYQKAYSTFIDSYILNRHIDGRVHGQFNQLMSDEGGTVSGRFSSSSPNLQNIPSRDPDIGPKIRELFLPEEGERWMAADYANQEPRILVHFAHILKLKGAAEAVAKYEADPTVSYHRIVQELLGPYIPAGLDPYKTSKTINLGKAYGMGGAKLCRSLGLETKWIYSERQKKMIEVAGDEGATIMRKYDEMVPFASKLAEMCQRRAESRGFIKTLSGRRCRFGGKFPGYHKALNRLVQGTAADQTKAAMIAADAAGLTVLLTMHDELGISVSSDAQIRQAREIMETAWPMDVPFVCDVDIGRSWGEARPFKDKEEAA